VDLEVLQEVVVPVEALIAVCVQAGECWIISKDWGGFGS